MDKPGRHHSGIAKSATVLIAVCAVALIAQAGSSSGATASVQPGGPFPLLAKATPDECFGGVGATYEPIGKDGICSGGRRPKTNQAYVWGMTKTRSDLWYGTAPNTACLVLGEILAKLGVSSPVETNSFVCEYGQSGYRASLPNPDVLDPRLGDWRPPQLLRYSARTGELTDLGAQLKGADDNRLGNTLGIRSAGSLGRTVLLAGPTLSGGIGEEGTGINVFAFDSKTGKLVDSTTIPAYSDIRRWIKVRGHLYTAVGIAGGGGALLRWNGNPDNPGTHSEPNKNLFNFKRVGTMPTEGADLASLKGRIYVTSWPIVGKDTQTAGLYQSAEIGSDGLPPSNEPMREVWSVSDYEPDPVTARTYLGGALEAFRGQLVWGTMHAPLVPAILHLFAGHETPDLIASTHRASALFKGRNLESNDPKIRILYGEKKLPAYQPATSEFVDTPNLMGQTPKFGETGFDNPFNLYTWSMGRTNRGLYVGTQDFSYVADQLLPPQIVRQITATQADPVLKHGADLMLFTSLNKPAKSISRTGVGNRLNYGVRTMIAQKHRMYLGTANPMNLLPEGGWELRRIGEPGS